MAVAMGSSALPAAETDLMDIDIDMDVDVNGPAIDDEFQLEVRILSHRALIQSLRRLGR